MAAVPQKVIIERGGLGFIVSDEDGEFAQTTTIESALTYAANLLHGPGTGAHVDIETYPAMVHADGINKAFGI